MQVAQFSPHTHTIRAIENQCKQRVRKFGRTKQYDSLPGPDVYPGCHHQQYRIPPTSLDRPVNQLITCIWCALYRYWCVNCRCWIPFFIRSRETEKKNKHTTTHNTQHFEILRKAFNFAAISWIVVTFVVFFCISQIQLCRPISSAGKSFSKQRLLLVFHLFRLPA